MDKFTIEEIEAAIEKRCEHYVGTSYVSFGRGIITVLTKFKWKPTATGQAYAYRDIGDNKWRISVKNESDSFFINRERRPLTLEEHGPAVRALVDSVENMTHEMMRDGMTARPTRGSEQARAALDKFKQEVDCGQ